MSELSRDTLYLACTRPAMKWGVPIEGYVLNVGLTWIFGMALGSPLYWAAFFPVHLVMRALANKNPNFFRELRLWLETKGSNITGTLNALPVGRPRKAAEVASAV
jgi:type IV secretion system protein VirB3